MTYKIIVTKTAYVEAEDVKDATDEYWFGSTYNEEEKIISIIAQDPMDMEEV